jgi:hypothetical protein
MKTDRKKNTITLSGTETKKWEDGGPHGYEFRKSVRDLANSMKGVEIYASKSAGGWMADRIESTSDDDD